MSLTFGYDLKDDDKILEAPNQLSGILRGCTPSGQALLRLLPFCAISQLCPRLLLVSQSHFQCGTFLHGSRSSVTNHWSK